MKGSELTEGLASEYKDLDLGCDFMSCLRDLEILIHHSRGRRSLFYECQHTIIGSAVKTSRSALFPLLSAYVLLAFHQQAIDGALR